MKLSLKNIIKKSLRIIIPLVCSILLILWLFDKVDLKDMMFVIRNNVNYVWLLIVMVIVALSHVIRGIRWGIQLRGAGVGNVPKMALCCSIFGAYSLNLLVPYMGEAWRIVYIAHRQKVPVATVLGTDIGDRGSDAVVVFILTLLALSVGHQQIMDFMNHYAVGAKFVKIMSHPLLWIGLFAFLISIVLILYTLRKNGTVQKIIIYLKRTWDGFAILFTMKGRWEYLVLTIGIWTCYFLETYLSFFAFPFTRHLIEEPGMAWGLLPGLIAFVFSSLSMVIPSNGGLGPWNVAVMFALSLFGVSNTEGAAFSMLVWGTTSLTLVLLGLYTIFYVTATDRKKVTASLQETN